MVHEAGGQQRAASMGHHISVHLPTARNRPVWSKEHCKGKGHSEAADVLQHESQQPKNRQFALLASSSFFSASTVVPASGSQATRKGINAALRSCTAAARQVFLLVARRSAGRAAAAMARGGNEWLAASVGHHASLAMPRCILSFQQQRMHIRSPSAAPLQRRRRRRGPGALTCPPP